jgi:hypothetical protein
VRDTFPPAGLRLVLLVTAAALSAAAFLFARQAVDRGLLFASLRWTAVTGIGALVALLALAILAASWTSGWDRLAAWFEATMPRLGRLGRLNLLLFLLLIVIYCYVVLGPAGHYLEHLAFRLALFWLTVLAGSVFLKAYAPERSWPEAMAAAWLLSGAGVKIATFIPEISTYPFSLGWSEASRYYYASLFFSERVYGLDIPPSALHPSRYLMQAIPFLVTGLPLWFHRFWQVLLWLVMSGFAAYFLSKRLRSAPGFRLSFIAWAFTFLFQGPVYYHLLVIPVLLFWGFDSQKFWRSLGVVLLASAWAGISRLNWFPVPGLLAATMYFCEVPLNPSPETGQSWNAKGEGLRRLVAYLARPAAWFGIGTLAALASQASYALWSGVEQDALTSSFTSDLLWYRLFPNSTFPPGILPAILLVAGPVLVLIILGMKGMHALRLLGLAAILAGLFTGGVIVSVKIGGGSNLHNLDAFLVVLLTVGSYVLFGRFAQDSGGAGNPARFPWVLVAAILAVPVLYAVSAARAASIPDRTLAEEAFTELEEMVLQASAQGGEVLFITERHLLTFGMLPEIPLVEKYETVFLMEMAMAGNTGYLNEFYADLKEKRFALIISDPLRDSFKGSEYSFGEENDVWVLRVAQPLLETYQRAEMFRGLGIEVLEPKP